MLEILNILLYETKIFKIYWNLFIETMLLFLFRVSQSLNPSSEEKKRFLQKCLIRRTLATKIVHARSRNKNCNWIDLSTAKFSDINEIFNLHLFVSNNAGYINNTLSLTSLRLNVLWYFVYNNALVNRPAESMET